MVYNARVPAEARAERVPACGHECVIMRPFYSIQYFMRVESGNKSVPLRKEEKNSSFLRSRSIFSPFLDF